MWLALFHTYYFITKLHRQQTEVVKSGMKIAQQWARRSPTQNLQLELANDHCYDRSSE
jgi:hypothetical protein